MACSTVSTSRARASHGLAILPLLVVVSQGIAGNLATRLSIPVPRSVGTYGGCDHPQRLRHPLGSGFGSSLRNLCHQNSSGSTSCVVLLLSHLRPQRLDLGVLCGGGVGYVGAGVVLHLFGGEHVQRGTISVRREDNVHPLRQ